MILAVDVGNTETVIGLLSDLEAVRCWRVATNRRRTGDELALQVSGFLSGLDAEPGPTAAGGAEPSRAGSAERAVLASVVPVLDRAWAQACHAIGLEPRFVNGSSELPIRLEVDAPLEVGADRIANTLAASELFGRDTIVVDLGTATTFDCIGADGAFLGGVIAPGPRAGIERLTTVATQLPQVEIHPPARVIGRRTVDCVDSGVFYSTVDAIDGIVDRILAEWAPSDPLVVATGGLAEVIAPYCRRVDQVEPFLTIKGLAVADRYLGGGP
jgi:type III pantothenate kinase